jgi:hypothetical protein
VDGSLEVISSGKVFDAISAPLDRRSAAFTSVAHLTDGTLLVAFRNASGRDSPDGRLRILCSQDTGRSWKTLHAGLPAVVDGVQGNLYSGYFTELTPGHLLGCFLWVDRSKADLSFVNPQTAGILPTRILLADSPDAGATWTQFRPVEMAPHVGCASTGPVWRLPGGLLALPYENWKEYDDTSPGNHGAQLRISSDQGRTWPTTLTVATDADACRFYWDQRVAEHPHSGRLAAMFWTHDRKAGQDLDVHIAWGEADGTGWTTPVATGLPGQHCQPLAVGGDSLVAFYVHRQDPPSLRAVLSQDFGHTWDRSTELVFYDSTAGAESGTGGPRAFTEFWRDMMAWRFGHPRAVLLPDGELFAVYYGGDEAATSVYWVRIRM